MDNTYIDSMRSHIAQLESELTALSQLAKNGPLGRYEYRAAERTLQVTIEACIGIAKHWCKQFDQVAPASAYNAFERLHACGIIDSNQKQWKRVIGMRNALVHDYLNIDPKLIENLLESDQHKFLINFANQGLTALGKDK